MITILDIYLILLGINTFLFLFKNLHSGKLKHVQPRDLTWKIWNRDNERRAITKPHAFLHKPWHHLPNSIPSSSFTLLNPSSMSFFATKTLFFWWTSAIKLCINPAKTYFFASKFNVVNQKYKILFIKTYSDFVRIEYNWIYRCQYLIRHYIVPIPKFSYLVVLKKNFIFNYLFIYFV